MAIKSGHLVHYRREERPWGNFEQFTQDQASTVKLIMVHEGEALSLQLHKKRDEFWRILSGSGMVILGDKQEKAAPGDEFFIPAETKHRIQGGRQGLLVLEIAFGDFDENDIVRFEDRYGRA